MVTSLFLTPLTVTVAHMAVDGTWTWLQFSRLSGRMRTCSYINVHSWLCKFTRCLFLPGLCFLLPPKVKIMLPQEQQECAGDKGELEASAQAWHSENVAAELASLSCTFVWSSSLLPAFFPSFHHLLLTPPSWINQGQITWGRASFVSTGEPPSLLRVIVSNKVGKYRRRLKQLSAPQHLHQTKLKKPSIPSHECTIKTMWQKWKLFHHNISQFFLTKAKPPSWIHISQHLMHYASAYSRGPGNCQSLVKDLWKCLFWKQMEPRPSTWAL